MVKSVDFKTLKIYIDALIEKIKNDSYYPDYIISVERAGRIIADVISKNFNRKLLSVSAQRKGQQSKKKMGKYVRFFPLKFRFFLREGEDKINLHKANSFRNVLLNFNEDLNNKNILIVDDAIDTGNSIHQIISKIKTIYPGIKEIKVAVITVTRLNPLYFPQYYVFKNIKCFFPWAEDSPYLEEFKQKYDYLLNNG